MLTLICNKKGRINLLFEKEEILLFSYYLLQVTLPENILQGELTRSGPF
jgi:hypothetical protein